MKLDREKINLQLAKREQTVSGIGRELGVSRQRMYVMLNSKNVLPKTAGRLAKVLGVDVTEIIEG